MRPGASSTLAALSACGGLPTLEMLVQVMSKVVSKMRDAGDKRLKEYERLTLISDLCLLKEKIKPKNMEHSAKIAISLLRYAGELPADRVFYEAGMGCKEMEWQNMAFVFLNRCASSFSISLLNLV